MSLKTPILTTPSVYCAKAELVASSAAPTIRLRVVFMLSLHAGPAALGVLSGVMAGRVPAIQIQTLGPHPEEAALFARPSRRMATGSILACGRPSRRAHPSTSSGARSSGRGHGRYRDMTRIMETLY